MDALETQVIRSNVRHNTDFAEVKAQTGAQQSAAGAFEDCTIHRRILQDKFRTRRTRTVAAHQQFVLNIDTVRRGIADFVSLEAHHVRNQTRGGRLSIGSGNGNDRNSCRASRRKQHINHRRTHVARKPFAWGQDRAEFLN